MAAEMTRHEDRLVLMTADTVGGVWSHALELAGGLGQRGVRVALATMGQPLTALQRRQVARLPTVTVHESEYRLEWMATPWDDVRRAGQWLLRLEASLRPDVVHLNQFAFGALPFTAPTLLVAHSCVMSWWRAVHGTAPPAAWDRYRQAVIAGLAGATRVGAPTQAMLASLTNNYAYAGRGVVLPNARSGDAYAPGTKEPLILSAGRLWDAAKNLAALEAVAPSLPWPVVVAGATAQPTGGVRQTRSVRALGELCPEGLAAEYARASIYALPARYEPFGQTPLEAALSGCALVLGDLPSLREIWGGAALYVPPDDTDALRACLMRLIDDPALRRRCAAKALARAQRFTPERMVKAYLAAYDGIVAPRVPAPARAATIGLQPETVCAS
ncbi:glycosyltransferase family 4 protein [Piscinibacter koreensis]|uniref:Glycosyltransferase family 4 protein n=1 Tax=Piscinibacter koreensis TaxID=2742824 RepID=A0A7Y6TW14_9BURK|nr:glycosyltransferase family 4 protein [Schlegelella koreensis]NUZ05553.1 glycosyltransferase family 4 protein [Schlegelella koreensis]